MYQSKYYTCEEIDERLLKGYYDDAVSKGYQGTFEQLQLELASVDLVDLNLLNSNAGYTLTEAVAKIDELSLVHLSIVRFRYTDKTYNKLRTLTYDSTKSALRAKVTDISTYTLTLTEFNGDMMKTLLTDLSKIGFEGSMYITNSGYICGKVSIFGDSMGHVVNQEVLTNCVLSSDRTSLESSHNHTRIFKYERFFNLSSSSTQDRDGNLVPSHDNSIWYTSTYEIVPDACVVCNTPAGTADKTISVEGYYTIPAHGGGSIKVKFTYANTVENPTLNISGTGAKPLYLGNDPVSPTNTWADGSIVEVFYDGENYRILSDSLENITDINNRIEAVNTNLSNIGKIAESANNKADECASNITDIDKRIEALENNARITLSVTPSVIHRNVTTSITIRANAYGFVPDTFSIIYNGQQIASNEGKTSITATIEASSSVTLSSKATYGGRNYTASASVKGVGVIYYGFMNDTENVTKTLSPRTSALGNYQLVSTLDNAKFFIMIPNDMSFPSSITMGGTPYVMDMSEVEKNGERYYMLTSGATYNAGAEININLS